MTRIWIRNRYCCGAAGDGHVRVRTLHNAPFVNLKLSGILFIRCCIGLFHLFIGDNYTPKYIFVERMTYT